MDMIYLFFYLNTGWDDSLKIENLKNIKINTNNFKIVAVPIHSVYLSIISCINDLCTIC